MGKVLLATTYLPSRRSYFPFHDVHKLPYNNHVTYLLAGMNATHRIFNDNKDNLVGRGLEIFIRQGKLLHLGPEFSAFHSLRNNTTPDLVLSNNKVVHNFSISTGPITESDHTPSILTITEDSVRKEIPPT